jgi:hypothetical protein
MLNTVEPYFFISKYNSHRFVQDFGTNIKTVANTLSYQETSLLNKKDYYQLFQNEDATRTQFRSSYANHRVKVFDVNGEHAQLEVVKRTNNLNIEDYRTAKKISANGKLAIYFGQGNILSSQNTSTAPYNLQQYVPYWMVVGKNINDDTLGEITIDSIIWLDSLGLYALLFDIEYTNTTAVNTQVRSIYNSVPYDYYDFDLDFAGYSEGYYQMQIEAWNTEDDKIYAISERMHVKSKHENTCLIIHHNDENHQINYSWDIQHMMRLTWEEYLEYSPDGTNTVNKTDQNTTLIDSENYEKYSIKFRRVPTGIAIMLKKATTQNSFFLDGVSYKVEENPETEKLDDLNEYEILLTMTLANDKYEDNSIKFKDYYGMNIITVNGSPLTINNSLIVIG